jgi:hypothetical protein
VKKCRTDGCERIIQDEYQTCSMGCGYEDELSKLKEALDMQKLISSEYKKAICEFLGIDDRKKLPPNDARIILSHLKQMQESTPRKGLEGASSETYHKLRAKVKKLKELMLLVDKEVSNFEMNKLTERQWSEFIRCFPEEK